MKLSIVIPAYNEEKRIEKTLLVYTDFFDKLKVKNKLNYKILVSINGTTDKTAQIVKKLSKKNKSLKYIDLKKGGKGYAVIEGFKECLKKESDFIGFVDGDLATGPESFYGLFLNIGKSDAIIASRYIKNAVVSPKQSMQRIVASRIYNIFIRALFLIPYRDTQCGAKLFKRRALSKIVNEIGMTKWAFDVELLYLLRKNNFTVKEFPTRWSDKEYSKINFMKSGPWMVLGVIRLRILHSPFRRFIKIYDKFLKFVPK